MSDLVTPAQVWATLQRRTPQARTPLGTTTVDPETVTQLSALINKFNLARIKGVRAPKIRLDSFLFKAAPPEGANPGAIYVEHIDSKIYLGKILNGKFMPTRDCGATQTMQVLAAAANPDKAAETYSQRTGMCCVCGRTLTNGDSIAARIGPICAGNFGF